MKKHQQVKTSRPAAPPAVPLAIVGMGCMFPKADHLGAYWANIREAVDCITDVPPTHWRAEDYLDPDPKSPDHTYMARGGFLSAINFNPMEFGIAPNAIEATDTTQLLGLIVAREALRDAGYGPERDFDRSRVSCVLGVTGTLPLVIPLGGRLGHPRWRQALREAGVVNDVAEDVVARISDSYVNWQETSFPGLLGNVVAGRIANYLDLGGTNCVVDAACASALGALHLAALELAAGRCDMVIGGGMDTFNDIFMYMCFSKTPALSPSGDARPYSAEADGTTLGEGLGAVVLKRLDDARRDGDRIYAVIRGIGSSSDGKGQAIYAPSPEGQSLALRRAHENAGVTPETIDLIEGHGTGTKAGDAAELTSLLDVFRPGEGQEPWCALGSVKSQIGHTKAAAGMAGLIKAALALYFKVLPPTMKVKHPAEALANGPTAFYISMEKRPWLPRHGHPRRAGVSAFGFGGSNFHCVLEEYEKKKKAPDWDGLVQILPFSAASAEALGAEFDAAAPPADWNAVRRLAHDLCGRFDVAAPRRLVLVAEWGKTDLGRLWGEARTRLKQEPGAHAWHLPGGAWYGSGAAVGKLALLFPGQGGTYPGMLRDLTCLFPEMLDTLAEANAALAAMPQHRLATPRLSDLIYPRPVFTPHERKAHEEALRATDVAQPAIGALSLGASRLFERFGVRPDAVAGHSYGELAALCAAGCFEPAALHALSRTRGSLMGAGEGDRGGMLAVRAGADATEAALGEAGLELVIANKNAPNQTVVAGESEALDRAAQALTAKGLHCTRLSVPAAFHSRFVAHARKPFHTALDAVVFTKPRIPVYANSTGLPYPSSVGSLRELLAGQLASPVEFVKEIQNLYESGVRTFVECGPGATLTGLVKAILGESECLAVALDASRGKASGVLDLARVLAQLAAAGHAVDLRAWDPDFAVAHPAAPASDKRVFTIPICGANYVKPRPARPLRRPAESVPPPEASSHPLPSVSPVAFVPSVPSVASVPAPPVALPQSPSPASASWSLADALRSTHESMAALQQIQEHTARLHQQYLEGQEIAQSSLQALIVQQQQVLGSALAAPMAMPSGAMTAVAPLAAFSGFAPPAAPQASAAPAPALAPAPVQRVAAPPQPLSVSAMAPAAAVPSPASASMAPASDVTAVLLAVISEKTGYPAEMLDLDMGLDSDLGIDSIKRVEILSAIQERLPAAPVIKPEHLGTLQTLRQIAEFLTAPGAATAATAGVDSRRASQALLEVISEKTGYPAEMLDLGMGLDADLGIDSIKRVEILAAIQERLPQAPVIKPEHLGTLQTLGQIVDFLSSEAPAAGLAEIPAAVASASATPPASASAAGVSRDRVVEVLLAVIAEKTGYPAEMLDLDMGLDSDLGIDSIKRVEILAAIQERLPEAPVIQPEHLGTLRTLGQIVEFLSAGAAIPSVASAAPSVAGAPSVLADVAPASVSVVVPSPVTAAPPATVAPARAVERLVLCAESLDGQARGARLVLPEGSHIWVLSEASELGWKLREELLARRMRPLLVSIRELKKMPRPERLAGLIVLAPTRHATDAFLREAFQVLRTAAPALRRSGSDGRPAFFVTVSRLDGCFGLRGRGELADVVSGGLAGLAKTAAQEWTEVACKALDLALAVSVEDAAAAILDEALTVGPAEVGLSEDGRLAPRLSLLPLAGDAPGAPAFEPGDPVIVTGGARGITADVAVALARAWQPTFVLMGRSALPEAEPEWLAPLQGEAEIKRGLMEHAEGHVTPREIGQRCARILADREIVGNLERIRQAGASGVVYFEADARDAAAVRAAVAAVRRDYGPIRGLVHGAGILADRLIEEKTDEQFETVYSTKVVALRTLLDALGSDDLRALVLFSSSTARFGRKGQADYAAANEVLNKMARSEAERRPRCRVLSVNWGPWAGGMVTPALAHVFEEEGIGLIEPAAGGNYLVRELAAASPESPVEVVVLGGGTDLARLSASLGNGLQNAAQPPPAVVSHQDVAQSPPAVNPSTTELPKSSGSTAKAGSSASTRSIVPEEPAPSDPSLTLAIEHGVSLAEMPVLASHVLDGRAVLPAALMVELLAHGAMHANPGLRFRGLADFRVFKGILLGPQDRCTAQVWTRRAVKGDGEFVALAELRSTGENGKSLLHARAEVLLGSASPHAIAPMAPPAGLAPWPAGRPFYGPDLLFHGPDMQAIQSVEGCGEAGVVALLSSALRPGEWIAEPLRGTWLAEPLLLDGAFQMLVLWSSLRWNSPSLPTRIETYEQYVSSFPAAGARAVARVTASTAHEATADIELLDAATGAMLARIGGYHCVIDASLAGAFRRNQLAQE